jgi:hypothetical protein
MQGVKRAGVLFVLLLPLACGSSSPTAPTPPPGPVTPLPPVVSIEGTWTGTVESANFAPRAVTLVIVQAYSCVDGDWRDATADWKGAISGLASADSFSGQVSFERSAAGGGKCIASGPISGTVEGDTFHWTAGTLTAAGTCNGELPQDVVLSARRQ